MGSTGLCSGAIAIFDIINDLEDNIASNVFKFADDMKLFRQVRDTADTWVCRRTLIG